MELTNFMLRSKNGLGAKTLLLLFTVTVTACAHTQTQKIKTYKISVSNPAVLLMPVDIKLTELSAGGILETRADWTTSARNRVQNGLQSALQSKDTRLVRYTKPESGKTQYAQSQLIKLHEVVGGVISLYTVLPAAEPPTKKDRFEWTLGPGAVALHDHYNADYALFVHIRDSYATAGRKALIIAGILFGVGVAGGNQVGYATLVDLRTGRIVWFNRLSNPSGDLRTAASAKLVVKNLLSGIPL